jgi:hypothetical protein
MVSFDVITMNPFDPEAISFAIDVPEQFSKICLVPFFKGNQIQTPMSSGGTDTVPSYRGLFSDSHPTRPKKRTADSFNFLNYLFWERQALHPVISYSKGHTTD